MVLEIYEYLLSQYAAQLGVATVNGNPVWARPDLEAPCIGLEIMGYLPGEGRTGQRSAVVNLGYQGWLFARNEPELAHLLDDLIEWHTHDGQAFEIAARRVACKLQESKRFGSETELEIDSHAQMFVVEVAYTA